MYKGSQIFFAPGLKKFRAGTACHRDGVQGDRLRDAGGDTTGGEEASSAPGTRDEREMGRRRAGAGVRGQGVRIWSEEEAVQGEPVESHVHCTVSISSWGALDVKLVSVLVVVWVQNGKGWRVGLVVM